MPSSVGHSFGGRMRLRRKESLSAEAPSAEEEKTKKMAEACAFGGTRTESCVGGNRRDQD